MASLFKEEEDVHMEDVFGADALFDAFVGLPLEGQDHAATAQPAATQPAAASHAAAQPAAIPPTASQQLAGMDVDMAGAEVEEGPQALGSRNDLLPVYLRRHHGDYEQYRGAPIPERLLRLRQQRQQQQKQQQQQQRQQQQRHWLSDLLPETTRRRHSPFYGVYYLLDAPPFPCFDDDSEDVGGDWSEKEVFGPPMLTCSVKDPRYSDLVQSLLQDNDLLCFTAQTKDGHKKLSNQFYEISASISMSMLISAPKSIPKTTKPLLAANEILREMMDKFADMCTTSAAIFQLAKGGLRNERGGEGEHKAPGRCAGVVVPGWKITVDEVRYHQLPAAALNDDKYQRLFETLWRIKGTPDVSILLVLGMHFADHFAFEAAMIILVPVRPTADQGLSFRAATTLHPDRAKFKRVAVVHMEKTEPALGETEHLRLDCTAGHADI
ncbi:hypothetical protein B0T24DRAFT_600219 [Lasiosphaeria ovina]|uniref:Uncharacterized protein n=1 Tax=Lasiosphaeria ovina TaxID=92902 RepID=A0AAE0MXD3_9PEZI|nr:hypothetical protein B0T24DRAFT_600219 [Lasiosphaeria ovina]